MCKIIAVDLDGTLLSSKNIVTEYTKKIIKFLIKKNFYFVLSSGRHYIDILRIQEILEIQSFIISSNGSQIYDLDNKLIFNDYLDTDIALELCKMKYLEQDIITQVYQNDQWYINDNKIDNNFCSNLSSLQYKYFHPDKFKYTNINKIFFTSKNFLKLHDLEKTIINRWGSKINISFSVPGCLEVISGKTSKGYGLKLISNLLGIPLRNFVSFGDGINDLEMLLISGKSYIMKNADLRLKKLLPHIKIIDSNNNDGVAKCLDKIFIQNKK
ncbi:Cof-type HAD-IIB family hydrolase [Buchnera aphidicola]|uniref:Cof-type HAD-IIB family hydrolase n=1 Tax=Buchnera aphidicola (Artemisaphis artemisicola) TaxID=1241836 RepID=A0A4D6XK48_9GAMM|nr:Cof-type HAD-IIB family hydrolase [Buchnera aphidicola]QCI15734.1 Cof-type HAD-IIB family hydrolase [Buchnera aphidicola (Artemisaphis artemisicola)]